MLEKIFIEIWTYIQKDGKSFSWGTISLTLQLCYKAKQFIVWSLHRRYNRYYKKEKWETM